MTDRAERAIRLFFDASLWLKALLALVEIASGITVWFASKETLLELGLRATRHAVPAHARDVVAAWLFHVVEGLSISAKLFAALYLVSHGVIKLWLVVGLLRRKLWYYPVAIVAFSLFIVYQLYRYTLTHSAFLIFLTALDVIVIALTLHEFRYLRRHALVRPNR